MPLHRPYIPIILVYVAHYRRININSGIRARRRSRVYIRVSEILVSKIPLESTVRLAYLTGRH